LTGHGTARDVDNGKSILVVVEADLLTLVTLLGSTVDDTLGIVNISIVAHTASILGSGRVGHVNHPETSTALEAVFGTNSSDKVGGFIGDNVVAAAEAGEVGGQVSADAVGGRVLGVSLNELGKVEDLKTVIGCFGSNVGVVANDLDVAPR